MHVKEYPGILLELFSRNPYIKNQNINFEERAPDAKSFSTYPSHKHTPNGIKEANMPAMQQVLDEISQRIYQNLPLEKGARKK